MDTVAWKYYMHAFLPTCQPHEEVDISLVQSGELWRSRGRSGLLARWTSDFDCGYETLWWYVIKDKPFDINALKAKRRYDIKRGIQFFEVRRIDPVLYAEQLYEVQVSAYSVYPEKYRPTVDKLKWIKDIAECWNEAGIYIFGAFYRETGNLCGYAMLSMQGRAIHFDRLKVIPAYEKQGINAAIVATVLNNFQKELERGSYICDGERNIQHETAFQDYLERTFGFRKAYCKLHVEYRPLVKYVVKILFPMRSLLIRFDDIRIVHKINGVLKMEEIVRLQNKR